MKKWKHKGLQLFHVLECEPTICDYRKNLQRQLDALQQSLDEETKAKNEQSRQRKLIEGQISDLEGAVEAKEKAVADQAKTNKKLQAQVKVHRIFFILDCLKICFLLHYRN